MRSWFDKSLETVATFWRIERCDGIALGFASHDRDLDFTGLRYRAAPGMVPSAIRLSTGFDPDSAEISGALTHDAIRQRDLDSGRFDGARITVGLVDWETGEHEAIYAGTIGAIGREGGQFTAELNSMKAAFEREVVPRTAPTCRAVFCGAGCTLSPARFSHDARLAAVDQDGMTIRLDDAVVPALLAGGTIRWVEGQDAGRISRVESVAGNWLTLQRAVDPGLPIGSRALVRQGCDGRLETCATRFGNARNFQGEPFLPGNDLLARYPSVA